MSVYAGKQLRAVKDNASVNERRPFMLISRVTSHTGNPNDAQYQPLTSSQATKRARGAYHGLAVTQSSPPPAAAPFFLLSPFSCALFLFSCTPPFVDVNPKWMVLHRPLQRWVLTSGWLTPNVIYFDSAVRPRSVVGSTWRGDAVIVF